MAMRSNHPPLLSPLPPPYPPPPWPFAAPPAPPSCDRSAPQEVLRGRLVALQVNAGDAEVVAGAHEIGVQAQRLLVRADGLLAAPGVGEGGAEAVPEEGELVRGPRIGHAGFGGAERGVEAVDRVVEGVGRVEEHPQADLHVRVHGGWVGGELCGFYEEGGYALVQGGAVGEADVGIEVGGVRRLWLEVPGAGLGAREVVRELWVFCREPSQAECGRMLLRSLVCV